MPAEKVCTRTYSLAKQIQQPKNGRRIRPLRIIGPNPHPFSARSPDDGLGAPEQLMCIECPNQRGYRVIRFWNEQMNRAMDDVLETIYFALADY
jgi:hypothetical protein